MKNANRKNIMHFFRTVFFNVNILHIFIFLYVKILRPQLNEAWSLFFKSQIKNMANSSKILGCITITGIHNLYIKDYVRIGRGCFFFADGGIEIGKGTIISRNVTIYSGNHNVKGVYIPYDDQYIYKKVTIGEGVWIGMNVCITPGVTIGDGAVIGMGAVISKDVPEGCVVVGSSQRIVKSRNMTDFIKNKDNNGFFAQKWPDK